jgi:hypothetical protein
MIPRFFGVFALFSVSLVVGSASAAQQESADQQAQFFHEKVLPLLEARCFECHGDGDFPGNSAGRW